jgi:glycine/D-amino acid oxidase-like deaminating enzyme
MPRSRRHTSHDVVIVGGGALGLACWRTAQRGMDVCVLERGRPGGGASHAAAGMLAPVTEADFGEHELLELSLAAAHAYPVFVEELEQAGGLEVSYRRCGALQVALDRHEAAELRRLHGLQLAFGLEAEGCVPAAAASSSPASRLPAPAASTRPARRRSTRVRSQGRCSRPSSARAAPSSPGRR